MPRILLLAAILAAAIPAGASSPVSDTTRAGIDVSVSPDPGGFISTYKGLGIGVTVTIDNLGWTGSELILNSQIMTRHGQYSAFLFSADPFEARVYAAGGIRYEGCRALGFSGLGPRSQVDDRQGVVVRRIEVEAGVGWYPLAGRRLLVQPVVRFLHDNVRAFDDFDPEAFMRLDEASRESLVRALGEPSYGFTFGPEFVLDFTDEPRHPRRGALASVSVRQYEGLDDDAFRYTSGTASLHGFLPTFSRRHVLEARAVLAITRESADRPVPFYALQTVDADLIGGYPPFRLVGRDLLALSLGAKFPLFDVFNWIGLEGELVFHAANVYDNVFDQFQPAIDFRRDLARGDGAAPLRPALTIGGHIMDLGDGRPMLSGQLGLSPEGFQLATLDFAIDLRARRPFVR